MKKIMLAAVAAIGLSGTAYAGADRPVTFNGYGEYAVEAEAFELGIGANFTPSAMQDLTLGLVAVSTYTSADSIQFDHIDLKAAYVVRAGVEAYGKVTLDDKFDYSEAVVGVAFSF